uniref:Uncharacterized protein n=1 Tax=Populus alba TaxID=43335 RepID=A0A4U5M9R2_POPAL|nr:hypothetical protein D5086_0000318030 [Populus alba]
MIGAFELNIAPWGVCFDELRPCIVIDGPLDRFAWIEATGSPIIGWNVTSIDRELSTLHFPVFEAIKYDMKAFNLMRGEEDDDQSPVVMERETAVRSNRKAMTEEVIDCWINIWDMRSRDAAITDVILRFKFLKQLLVQITERIELSATGKGPSDVVVVKAQTNI